MRNTITIALQEISTYLKKPSYLFTTLLIPAILLAGSFFLGRSSTPDTQQVNTALNEIGDAEVADLPTTGRLALVDESGIVSAIPDALAAIVQRVPDRATAEQALRDGRVDAYYVIAPDYMSSGDVERVARRFTPLAEDSQVIDYLLRSTLLSGIPDTVQALIREPIRQQSLQVTNIGTRAADTAVGGGSAGGIAYGLAYGLAMLIYVSSFASAGYLLQGLATERENRVMEILLTTVTPLQLLAGKIAGLGILGLGQLSLWAVAALLAARQLPSLPLEALGITPTLVALVIAYFILAYLLYSAQMGALGALVPSIRENGPATFFVVLPSIVPLLLLNTLVEDPHGTVATVLSLFPFTAPMSMVIRLAQGGVPAWQLALSIGLLLLTIPLMLWLTARLFRAQNLLGSTMPSVRQMIAAVRRG